MNLTLEQKRDPALEQARRAYLEQRVQGADPEDLLLMLYDGARGSVGEGQRCLSAEDWEGAVMALGKARRIVTYLLSSLRKEGGEISERLHQLYVFCFETISQASLEKRPELLDGVLRVLGELSGAYGDLARQGEAGEPLATGQHEEG